MARFSFPGVNQTAIDELPHIFAMSFQIRRAFFEIFNNIISGVPSEGFGNSWDEKHEINLYPNASPASQVWPYHIDYNCIDSDDAYVGRYRNDNVR